MLRRFKEAEPLIHPAAYVHDSAEIIGRVTIKKNANIWPLVVMRGDIERITIGEDANVQDGTMVHTDYGKPVVLGRGVTVGHAAIIHGAHVGDFSLIGMGAILLDGSVIGKECLVGAGALVPQGVHIPPRSLVLGLPGRVVRKLTPQEVRKLHSNAKDYVAFAAEHLKTSYPVIRKFARKLLPKNT
jgi:carbonic anhydrase/acetyltransferase-like protein (isoleucine patch superfamily)